jgi:hypothetical protein
VGGCGSLLPLLLSCCIDGGRVHRGIQAPRALQLHIWASGALAVKLDAHLRKQHMQAGVRRVRGRVWRLTHTHTHTHTLTPPRTWSVRGTPVMRSMARWNRALPSGVAGMRSRCSRPCSACAGNGGTHRWDCGVRLQRRARARLPSSWAAVFVIAQHRARDAHTSKTTATTGLERVWSMPAPSTPRQSGTGEAQNRHSVSSGVPALCKHHWARQRA